MWHLEYERENILLEIAEVTAKISRLDRRLVSLENLLAELELYKQVVKGYEVNK